MIVRRHLRGSFVDAFDDLLTQLQIQLVQIETARCPSISTAALIAAWAIEPEKAGRPHAVRRRKPAFARTINDKLSTKLPR